MDVMMVSPLCLLRIINLCLVATSPPLSIPGCNSSLSLLLGFSASKQDQTVWAVFGSFASGIPTVPTPVRSLSSACTALRQPVYGRDDGEPHVAFSKSPPASAGSDNLKK